MKGLLILLLLNYASSDKLDLTYLPPPGSQYSGGSPGDIQTPLEYPKDSYSSTFPPQSAPSNQNVPNPDDYKATIGINRGVPSLVPDSFVPQGSLNSFQNSYNLPTTTVSYAFTQTTTHPPFENFETTLSPIDPITGLPITTTFNNPSQEVGQVYRGNNQFRPNVPGYQQTVNIINDQQPDVVSQMPGSKIPFQNTQNYKEQSQPEAYQTQQGFQLPNSDKRPGLVSQVPFEQAQYPRNQSLGGDDSTTVFPSSTVSHSLLPIDTNDHNNNLQDFTILRPGLIKNFNQSPNIYHTGGKFQSNQNRYSPPDSQHSQQTYPGNDGSNLNIPSKIYAQGNNGIRPSGLVSSEVTKYIQKPERPQAETDRNAVILNYKNIVTPEGFEYSFDTSNGIHMDENGTAIDGVKAEGSYSYTGDDGKIYSIIYTADENGFQPHGDHLPTPPPIPEAIQRLIEKANREKEAGIIHDGSYDEERYGYKTYQGPSKHRPVQSDGVTKYGVVNGSNVPKGEHVYPSQHVSATKSASTDGFKSVKDFNNLGKPQGEYEENQLVGDEIRRQNNKNIFPPVNQLPDYNTDKKQNEQSHKDNYQNIIGRPMVNNEKFEAPQYSHENKDSEFGILVNKNRLSPKYSTNKFEAKSPFTDDYKYSTEIPSRFKPGGITGQKKKTNFEQTISTKRRPSRPGLKVDENIAEYDQEPIDDNSEYDAEKYDKSNDELKSEKIQDSTIINRPRTYETTPSQFRDGIRKPQVSLDNEREKEYGTVQYGQKLRGKPSQSVERKKLSNNTGYQYIPPRNKFHYDENNKYSAQYPLSESYSTTRRPSQKPTQEGKDSTAKPFLTPNVSRVGIDDSGDDYNDESIIGAEKFPNQYNEKNGESYEKYTTPDQIYSDVDISQDPSTNSRITQYDKQFPTTSSFPTTSHGTSQTFEQAYNGQDSSTQTPYKTYSTTPISASRRPTYYDTPVKDTLMPGQNNGYYTEDIDSSQRIIGNSPSTLAPHSDSDFKKFHPGGSTTGQYYTAHDPTQATAPEYKYSEAITTSISPTARPTAQTVSKVPENVYGNIPSSTYRPGYTISGAEQTPSRPRPQIGDARRPSVSFEEQGQQYTPAVDGNLPSTTYRPGYTISGVEQTPPRRPIQQIGDGRQPAVSFEEQGQQYTPAEDGNLPSTTYRPGYTISGVEQTPSRPRPQIGNARRPSVSFEEQGQQYTPAVDGNLPSTTYRPGYTNSGAEQTPSRRPIQQIGDARRPSVSFEEQGQQYTPAVDGNLPSTTYRPGYTISGVEQTPSRPRPQIGNARRPSVSFEEQGQQYTPAVDGNLPSTTYRPGYTISGVEQTPSRRPIQQIGDDRQPSVSFEEQRQQHIPVEYGNLRSTTYRPGYTISGVEQTPSRQPLTQIDDVRRPPVDFGQQGQYNPAVDGSSPIYKQNTGYKYEPIGIDMNKPDSHQDPVIQNYQTSTERIIGEDFSGPKQQQRFDPKLGYYY